MSRPTRIALWSLTFCAAAVAAYAAARLAYRHTKRPSAEWVTAVLQGGGYPAFEGVEEGQLLTPDGWARTRARVYHDAGHWRCDYEAGPSAGHTIITAPRPGTAEMAIQAVDHAARLVLPGACSGEPQPLQTLLDNYQPVLLGADRVAGRSAYVVELHSRRGGTVAMRVWFDAETQVPLRTETCNAEGRLVASSEFTEIRFVPTLEPSLWEAAPQYRQASPETLAEHTQSIESLRKELGFRPVEPDEIGAGYRLSSTYHYRCRGGNNHAEFRYQDGLRTLSVFEAKRRYRHGRGPGGRHGQGRGPGAGAGRTDQWGFAAGRESEVMDWGLVRAARAMQGDFRVVAIGDLPTERLAALAQSTVRKLESANANVVSSSESE